jgi:hypothetical protein
MEAFLSSFPSYGVGALIKVSPDKFDVIGGLISLSRRPDYYVLAQMTEPLLTIICRCER